MTDLSKQYRKHTHREHILALPDTYIGSIENAIEDMYVDGDNAFELKSLSFNPGFYKLFDELLVNAHDHVVRLNQRKSDQPVKHIDISIKENTITVYNDGESIDIEKHPDYGIYIPQMIFGELLTSTNYDTNEKKLVGGKNGYGVKLVNIFAKKMTITIIDGKRQLKYVQSFEDNMSKVGEPKITTCKNKPFVQIDWVPDLSRFGWKDTIPTELLEVVRRRVFDLAATVGRDVKITWCDTPVKFRDFTSYASWYLPKDAPIVTEVPQVGWQVAVADTQSEKFFSVSFVNGIWTRSGKHVDEITNQLVAHLTNYMETKKKIKVRPSMVKDSLAVFISCSVENPSFSSQTKEVMTTKVSCKLSDDFLKKLITKLNIVDKILDSQTAKDMKEVKKTDGKKQSKITGIPKLDDAVYAGTAKSHDCTLILTEGDSAKAMALSGLTQEQRNYYGVFPLKGKLLNVKDTSVRKVEQTEEIANLKKIIGLESGKKYEDVKSLRYGRVLIMTDQDYDGSHIRGLLINMFHELWHELLAIKGFITYMATPIVKATKGTQVINFYTQYEYEQWKKTQKGTWTIKYYKGLGTSTSKEAKEYFGKLNVVPYTYTGDVSDKHIDLAFNKAKANDRKDWLKTYDPSAIVSTITELPYEEFVNKDLIHFSNYNLERSIPNIMDGLKTSQRKILYSAFKRNLKSEIKVAQFAGYVSEHSGYHHGEMSLNDAIVAMAQDFVGSNNIPWFVPQGQFGTRLQGGKDSASSRYIHTYLQPYVQSLVPKDDFACLTYRDDDGLPVEPDWYAPILPMLLVNGCRGIGTGYSTYIPSYNPADLKAMILEWLETDKGLNKTLVPYYRNFKGTITGSGDDYVVHGSYTVSKNEIVITELPVETWTSDFRETLESMLAEGKIKDFVDTSTDVTIHIRVKTEDVSQIDKILTSKIKTSNMHAFNSKGVIQKYTSPNEILKEYCTVRLALYETRRKHILQELKAKIPYHENIVRFIQQQCLDTPCPDLRRRSPEECDAMLEAEKFVKVDDSYSYLLNLPIASITMKHLEKHTTDLKTLRDKIADLDSATGRSMWFTELSELKI
jgi:DNA topoisomerase-2